MFFVRVTPADHIIAIQVTDMVQVHAVLGSPGTLLKLPSFTYTGIGAPEFQEEERIFVMPTLQSCQRRTALHRQDFKIDGDTFVLGSNLHLQSSATVSGSPKPQGAPSAVR